MTKTASHSSPAFQPCLVLSSLYSPIINTTVARKSISPMSSHMRTTIGLMAVEIIIFMSKGTWLLVG